MRQPGIEPGSTAWKAAMLTTIPLTHHTQLSYSSIISKCRPILRTFCPVLSTKADKFCFIKFSPSRGMNNQYCST